MNIPAYAAPTLSIGRTYDAENSKARGDIFQGDQIPIKNIDVHKFSFKYSLVKNSKDVNDLLDVSGELALKIKASLLKVEGAGQYLNESKNEEGTTKLLAVMKCVTVTDTINGNPTPLENTAAMGTHYVKSVTYGAELVASLTFKTSSTFKKEDINGRAEGELNASPAVDVGLKAELQKLSNECANGSKLELKFYSTGLPVKLPTNIEELTKEIENFPSRMKEVNKGKGIPVQYELLPTTDIVKNAKSPLQDRVAAYELDELNGRFDDLRDALEAVNKYFKQNDHEQETPTDITQFFKEATKVDQAIKTAISSLGRKDEKKTVKESIDEYNNALDGLPLIGKFFTRWKKIYGGKVPSTDIKLPGGKPLSLVLLGKTGSGKSATGNSILGQACFKRSRSSKSATAVCRHGMRTEEREIDVIDTPGVLDNSALSVLTEFSGRKLKAYSSENTKKQNEVLHEVSRIFAMAPRGFDGFLLVARFDDRFTDEDAQALKMIQTLLGKEAFSYMIFVLTRGDQAESEAQNDGTTVEEVVKDWISDLPKFVQNFIKEINNRYFLFNNFLNPEKEPGRYKSQLSELIELIDQMVKGKGRYVHTLTQASGRVLKSAVEKALEESGINDQLKKIQEEEGRIKEEEEKAKRKNEEEAERIKKEKQEIEKEKMKGEEMKRIAEEKQYKEEEARRMKIQEKEDMVKKEEEEAKREHEKVAEKIENLKQEIEKKKLNLKEQKESIAKEKEAEQKKDGGNALEVVKNLSGGCYPGSATIVDIHFQPRKMESLKVGDVVQVVSDKEIHYEPVITFIHRQSEVTHEFLEITTLHGKKILKITEDHLVFVEKGGQAAAIPARDVNIGDTLYVIDDQNVVKKDAVQNIRFVWEKGVYAPVTLSGTILVNDVHTSCYFDVLSHEWSHWAMGVARAVYQVSPWMVKWLSNIGQKDGFPGWCRLAYKMLTLME